MPAGQPGADGVLQKDGKPFQFTMDVGQRGVLAADERADPAEPEEGRHVRPT